MGRKLRDWIAIGFLGACLLAGSIHHLTDSVAYDWFRDMSGRMASLGAAASVLRNMGASGEEIGYLADPPNDPAFRYGLQYQMLPSILIESASPRFVIVRTTDPARLSEYERNEHLKLLGNGGDGFYLLKHEAF